MRKPSPSSELARILSSVNNFECAFRKAVNSRTKHYEVIIGCDIPPMIFRKLMLSPDLVSFSQVLKKEPKAYGSFGEAARAKEFVYFAVYDAVIHKITDYIDRNAISRLNDRD